MRKFKNTVTGEINIATVSEFVSISSTSQKNVNGTSYRVATVKIDTPNKGKQTVSAIVFEANVDLANKAGGFTPGDSYLTTISPGDDRGPLVNLSHLQGAGRLENNSFDFSEVILEEDVKA